MIEESQWCANDFSYGGGDGQKLAWLKSNGRDKGQMDWNYKLFQKLEFKFP